MIIKIVCLVCKYILKFEGSVPIYRISCPICCTQYTPKEISKMSEIINA
jgi:hypothetical protein